MAPSFTTEVVRTTTAPASPGEGQQPSIIETVTILANDPIPNIRFNVAKAFEVLATVLQPQEGGTEIVKESVVPGLLKLKEDEDADVRYFAGKALEVSLVFESRVLALLTDWRTGRRSHCRRAASTTEK